jgi:hypothetical protein
MDNKTEDYHYYEELISLVACGTILAFFKLVACCYSLGLAQKHKKISLRRDSLSIAKLNSLKIENSRLRKLNLEEITCTCSSNPEVQKAKPSAVPKPEPVEKSCVPALPQPAQVPALPLPAQQHVVTVHFNGIPDVE